MRKLLSLWVALAFLIGCAAPAWSAACSLTTLSAGPPKVVVCTDTAATTITVPADWPGGGGTVETIGGGGTGAGGAGGGGGGGAYSKTTALSLTPSGSVTIQVGGPPQ